MKNYIYKIIVIISLILLSGIVFYLILKETRNQIPLDDKVLVKETVIYHPTEDNKPISILIFGDMMLDRFVRQKINENGAEYPFELIKDFIWNNDIVVANSEGSFTSFDSVTVGKKDAPLNFTFDPNILPTLKNLGFTLLGLANNHTLNFGADGLNQSKTFMTLTGINYFGDAQNIDNNIYVKNINSEKIGFIAYNEFAYQGLENILSIIKEADKTLSYIIVYPHWGEEYNLGFTSLQQKTAHSFIDAGADVVIGMHPHVIEPIEIYNNKPIFYSIGNFIFDQSPNGPTGKGLALKIALGKDSITYNINPFFIKKAQASLMDDESHQEELNNLAKNTVASDNFKNDITTGFIKISR